jgi:hypothetical protein
MQSLVTDTLSGSPRNPGTLTSNRKYAYSILIQESWCMGEGTRDLEQVLYRHNHNRDYTL